MRRILLESTFAPFWREIIEGITLYVREGRAGWQLYCVSSDEFVRALGDGADGALSLLAYDDPPSIAAAKRSRIPTVNLLRNVFPQLPSVSTDHHAIGSAAADYFLRRGFRHFAYVGPDRQWSMARLKGFARRLAGAGHSVLLMEPPPANDELRKVSSPRVMRDLERWIRALPVPVALFAGADYISRHALEACRRAGVRVPEQVAILGVDNDAAICEVGPITLSSIPQNFSRIGFEGARLLDGLIDKRRNPRGPVIIPPRDIVARASTDVIAVENPHVARALRYIHESPAEQVTMKRLLEQVPLSRQWLDRLFKEAIGRTASDEIRRVKFDRTRRLLLDTQLSIHEIARLMGFTQAENLTRFFRAQTGVSPRQFREQH